MVTILKKGTEEFDLAVNFAERCSWEPGRNLARRLKNGAVSDGKNFGTAPEGAIVTGGHWELPIVCFEEGKPAGITVLADHDYPEVSYTPWVGPTFVSEEFRGHRISQKILEECEKQAAELGYDVIYLVTEHINLYEKYGYERFESTVTPWDPNQIDGIYRKRLC